MISAKEEREALMPKSAIKKEKKPPKTAAEYKRLQRARMTEAQREQELRDTRERKRAAALAKR